MKKIISIALAPILFSTLATDISAATLDYSYAGQVTDATGVLSDNYNVSQNIFGALSINFGSEDGVLDSFGNTGGTVTSLSFNTGCSILGCSNSIGVVEDASRIINSSTDTDAQISAFDLLSLDGHFAAVSNLPGESGKLYLDEGIFSFLVLGEPVAGLPNILGSVVFSGSWARVTPLSEVSPVPVPAAVWLFGSGLLGLIGVARRINT